MTKKFGKWTKKQKIPYGELFNAIKDVIEGAYEANSLVHLLSEALIRSDYFKFAKTVA